jgi:hypothetical protein
LGLLNVFGYLQAIPGREDAALLVFALLLTAAGWWVSTPCRKKATGSPGRGGILPGYGVDDPEPQRPQRKPSAEDDVVRAAHPDGPAGLEDAARLRQPPLVELMVALERAERPVPSSFVYGVHTSVLHRDAAVGEPVGRVGEDGIHPAGEHEAHEVYAVGEVDRRPRPAERFEIPKLHTPLVGAAGPEL